MSQNTRDKLYAEVEYRQVPVGAAEGATFTATGIDTSISVLTDLTSELSVSDYATPENGRWPLDETMDIMPDTNRGIIGIWGSIASGSDKTFATATEITGTLSAAVTSAGFTVWFDAAKGAYSPSFTIKIYNGATLLNTISATATNFKYAYKGTLSNYNKAVITIPCWSVAGQIARVNRVMPGIIYVDEDVNTTEFSVLRQVDPVNSNNQSSELRFAVSNLDGNFSRGNPVGTYDYIKDQQIAIPRIGFKNEKVPLGRYFLSDWWFDDFKASFQALDALSLTDITFPDTTYSSATTLAAIAITAFGIAGITKYSLDPSLLSISVTPTISSKTCRNVLSDIATAACLTLYVDVYGVTTIGTLPSTVTGYTITWANSQNPLQKLDKPVKSITVSYGTSLSVSATYNSTGDEKSISGNPFITTLAVANSVLAWLGTYYARRAYYTNDWRQNPKIQPGDVIAVQGKYSTPNTQVTSQQYTYSGGGLTGQTISREV
jgi:hypothetical protein